MPHYKNKTARQSKGRADGMKLVLQISFIVRLLQVLQVRNLREGSFFVDEISLVLRDLVCCPSASDFAGVRNLRGGRFFVDGIKIWFYEI